MRVKGAMKIRLGSCTLPICKGYVTATSMTFFRPATPHQVSGNLTTGLLDAACYRKYKSKHYQKIAMHRRWPSSATTRAAPPCSDLPPAHHAQCRQRPHQHQRVALPLHTLAQPCEIDHGRPPAIASAISGRLVIRALARAPSSSGTCMVTSKARGRQPVTVSVKAASA